MIDKSTEQKIAELEMALVAAILAKNTPNIIGLKSQIRQEKAEYTQADIMSAQLRLKFKLLKE